MISKLLNRFEGRAHAPRVDSGSHDADRGKPIAPPAANHPTLATLHPRRLTTRAFSRSAILHRPLPLRGQRLDADECPAMLIPQPQAGESSGFLHLHVAHVGSMRQ